jgi:thioredoxin reductase (NADPH)
MAVRPTVFDTRFDQMFPKLEPAEVDRMRRFGEVRNFASGDYLVRAGERGMGLFRHHLGRGRDQVARRTDRAPIVTHEPGSFSGELATLSGRPRIGRRHRKGAVSVLNVVPDRLRNVLVEEAELARRSCAALHPAPRRSDPGRRGGPVIIGRPDSGDVLSLVGFLTRNWTTPPTAGFR